MPTTLITGAARGLGAAIARRLGPQGHHVIINYRTSSAAANEVVRDVEGAGELAGAFHITKRVLEPLRAQGDGRLIYIGSTAADYVGEGRLAHGTAKSALTTFARHVAAECARDGVSVLVVAPRGCPDRSYRGRAGRCTRCPRRRRRATWGDVEVVVQDVTPCGQVQQPLLPGRGGPIGGAGDRAVRHPGDLGLGVGPCPVRGVTDHRGDAQAVFQRRLFAPRLLGEFLQPLDALGDVVQRFTPEELDIGFGRRDLFGRGRRAPK